MALDQAWRRVVDEARRLARWHLRELSADAARTRALTLEVAGLTLDLSREKLDGRAVDALLALADAAELAKARDALFAGAEVNTTERRAALHMALRGSAAVPAADAAEVAETTARARAFAEAVRAGVPGAAGAAGGAVSDVVCIGIGGSDLGPAMAARALTPWLDGPRLSFVSNVDGAHLADTLADLDPARCLAIIVSKSFTTLETMANARAMRAWLSAALGARQASRQMAAVSSAPGRCEAFGIPAERVFGFCDWVGGRYSLWSSVGLGLMIGIGPARFDEMLEGARAVDERFRDAGIGLDNAPVAFGLLGVWRRLTGAGSVALIPYAQRLERFPAFVQQLEMESNGKGVTAAGRPLSGLGVSAGAPVIWGEPGTNAQHSFFQLLHQGTETVPVDFILAARPVEPGEDAAAHHRALAANCLAQSRALAFGRDEAEIRRRMAEAGTAAEEIDRLAPHRACPGDRPSTTILMDRLEPRSLGALIALYEARVAVQAMIWGINAFDQWGVELGKELAGELIPVLDGGAMPAGLDPATVAMLARLAPGAAR